MDLLSLAFIAVLASPAPAKPGGKLDFDEPLNATRSTLDSPFLRDKVTAAMALPYKFGVTQMPCRAFVLQPTQGWAPAREPSGKIAWVSGPETSVKWGGIYGTCTITSPQPREALSEGERSALECECNGWLPQGVPGFPEP